MQTLSPLRKTVIITGAASGFGRGIVSLCLARGYNVIATCRRAEERRSQFTAEINQYPEQLVLLELDVTNSLDRKNLKQWISNELGGEFYALINNAGFGINGALEDVSETQIRKQFEVNVIGLILLIQDLLPELRKSKGRVINLSSALGFAGMPMYSLYSSSKFAVEGLSESLWHELYPYDVQFAIVEPGEFETKFSENVEWGERSFAPQSAYQKQTLNFKKRRENRKSHPSADPTPVIRGVVNLLDKKRMPLRTRFGFDCHGSRFLRNVLPEFMYLFILRNILDKIFLK